MPDDQTTYSIRDDDLSDHPTWRHWTWWLRPIVAFPLMLFVLLMLSPFLVRAWHLSKVPDIADPFDVEAFLSETVDDKDNAFVDYYAARALLVPESTLTSEERQELDAGWEKTSPPVRAWVDANLPALQRWRIGTEKNDAIDGDLRNDPWLALPEVAPARDFSQLAWLQGEREQSEGHIGGAWQWYRAAMRYSRHVARRKDCIGRTLGCSLHSSTARRMIHWANDSRTSVENLTLALSQLDEDFRLTRPFSELLKVTYVDLPKYAAIWDDFGARGLFGSWRSTPLARYCRAQPDVAIRWNKLAIENWLCGSHQPRWLQRRIHLVDAVPVLDATATKSGISGTQLQTMAPFADRNMAADFAKTLDYLDQELARQQTLRIALAGQIRFRQKGAFPAGLSSLVPDLLTEIPIDPFSRSGELIRYRLDGDEGIVYSIGLDQSDDHGSLELIPGKDYPDIGYRLVPPRHREGTAEQKPSDVP